MIDHTGFMVSDVARSKAFYVRALAPLGYEVIMELSAAMTGRGYYGAYVLDPDGHNVEAVCHDPA